MPLFDDQRYTIDKEKAQKIRSPREDMSMIALKPHPQEFEIGCLRQK